MGGETDPFVSNNNGGGGGGGFGAVITGLNGSGGTITVQISAGNGGTTGYRSLSGGGGNGGTGLLFLQLSGDNVVTLSAGASVQGGTGGAGMTRAGDAGTGLVIRDGTGNNTFNLAGTISGGDENYIFNSHIGGNGGNGIAVVNMNGLTTLNISADVTGGSGGEGFTTGGNGGAGITGDNLAINVDGSQGPVTVSGGAGASFFAAGLGGAGIIGSDLAIVLTGAATVAGGGNGISGATGTAGNAAAIDFTGGTNSLELHASDAGSPTLTGNIVHAGGNDTLTLSGSGTGSIEASQINGFGTFVKEGSSTWTISGGLPVFSVSSWTLNGGTVSISGNVFGASAPILINGATLATTASFLLSEPIQLQGTAAFSPAAGTSLILSAELSGSSALTKLGGGTLILAGVNAGYAGPVTLAAGTLELSGIGGLPGATSWTLNGGSLDVSQRGSGTSLQMVSGTGAQSDINVGSTDVTLVQPANASYAGTFSGTGSLTKTGAGALVLTGDSPFTGTTTIAEGTLQLGDGGTSGWLAGAIVNNGTLAINRSDSVAISNTITGPGALLLQGGGTVTFASGYSGSVSAVGSSIQLSGTNLANASLALESGSVLYGNGAVGTLTVLASGIVAPGNSPGTLTVNGPVLFSGASVYRVDATPTGGHDLITATGTVTLSAGSAVQVVAAPGSYAANTTYTILTTTDAVNGTFGSVSSNYAFLSPTLSYDAQNVYLTLTYTGTQFASLAQTANHASVAGTVQGLGFGNEVFDTLLLLPASAVPGALDALSGDAYASVGTVIQQQSIYVREAVGERLRQALTAPGVSPLAYGAGPQTAALGEGLTPTLWMQGYGGWGDTSSDGNAASISNSIGGFLMGADVELAPNVRAGLFGGFSQSWFDVDDRNASGSMDSYDIGVYAGAQFGAIALRGGAAYAWNDVSVSRTVSFPGLWQALEADYTTGTTQIFGEVGYDMAVGAYAFEPFAGLAYVHVGGADFTESGGSAALSVSTDSMATLYSTLGVRVATTLEVGGRTLTPHATIGWQHAFGDITPDAALAFAGGSTPFTAAGVPIAEDTLLLEAGLRYALTDTAQLGASYSGQFGDGATQNAFTVNFSMKF
ncbi:autotransporter domain-containing protein [Ancylobacter sp. WKF20]|uniref:autotransporter domain-containing protein n=1 Tax=Ancylobacter sp. WKF20 TaxID=3039801 RepID=UPI0024341FE3|nr:autotransporter domain-containing protein [Ancylobacter sp. WKF20]WGD32252.1 autotransporter domain-containing protein [Ancylobacter sp. WKF20]